ncbi:glycosyltransferase family protein [Kineobactrum salinum]|uniref:Glycosyltransferase family 2 protein n=1 Tax=Kineobactrum salinum TaxID=2708301 RepID=A0A6C0U2X4_9GAMM|nr:glycosyltransferase family 2 protein [Kineobactrum salinum]QIB66376.1 glycosyltransferase family 2 protein [Kineobactrum salinum]
MNPTLKSAASLTVSVVLYHSDLACLELTLTSLLAAVAAAREEGVLAEAGVVIEDNSVAPAYHQRLGSTLERLDWAAAGVSLRCRAAADNGGYGAGHNGALRDHRDSDLYLVLNPDVELDRDALSTGLQFLQTEPDAVLVCPRGRDGDDAPAHLGKRYPTVLALVLRAFAPAPLRAVFARQLAVYEMHEVELMETPVEVPLASGCCMLLRAGSWREVGGFDPRYFLYFEDFDLSLRLARLGRVYCLPQMTIRHFGGGSAAKGWRHRCWFLRSGIRFFNSHGWRWI